jgi:molybdopterin-guanine dinucleotide biosynthesis protein A
VAARAPDADAIAFTPATHDALDPMLSIWEPAAQEAFLQRFAAGERSPRRMLQAVRLRTITPPDPARLLDRNSPSS